MPKTSRREEIEVEIFRADSKLPTEASRHSNLSRLFTDWRFGMRVLRYVLRLPTPLDTEDRRKLEQVVFKYLLAQPNTKKVLFVGCDWYTRHYERTFFRGCEYWTMDFSPDARRFAGKRHIVGPLQDLGQHFPEAYFDLIICNGVYGFGLDAPEDCERAFELCYSRLRNDGVFLLGWNDIPARTPVPLESLESLGRFRKFECPELGTWRYVTDTPYRHTFDFYRR
jgi:SAM-dependent methyltransferase